jgi:hypothetical protein
MNLFRSEEHVTRWLGAQGFAPGETLSERQICELAYAWWSDRLDPDWRPHTPEENQAILVGVGLTGPFWRLT